MRLVYDKTGKEVKIGDAVNINGEECVVAYFTPPHKPSASGRVIVSDFNDNQHMYYVGVIGATWIEREDQ